MNLHNVLSYYPYRFGFPCTVDLYCGRDKEYQEKREYHAV